MPLVSLTLFELSAQLLQLIHLLLELQLAVRDDGLVLLARLGIAAHVLGHVAYQRFMPVN